MKALFHRISGLTNHSKVFLFSIFLISTMAFALALRQKDLSETTLSQFTNDSLNRQSQLLAQLTDQRLELFKAHLVEVASFRNSFPSNKEFRQTMKDFRLDEKMSPFGWMALVVFEKDQWQTKWLLQNEKNESFDWDLSYTKSLLQGVSYNDRTESGFTLERLSDPSGQALFALSFSVRSQESQGTLVAIGDASMFNDLMISYKGASDTGFIINESGFVIAHPTTRYFGNLLTEHTVVKAVLHQENLSKTHHYDLSNNRITGSYQPIPNTNLYAVLTTTENSNYQMNLELLANLFIVAISMILFSYVISFLFSYWLRIDTRAKNSALKDSFTLTAVEENITKNQLVDEPTDAPEKELQKSVHLSDSLSFDLPDLLFTEDQKTPPASSKIPNDSTDLPRSSIEKTCSVTKEKEEEEEDLEVMLNQLVEQMVNAKPQKSEKLSQNLSNFKVQIRKPKMGVPHDH